MCVSPSNKTPLYYTSCHYIFHIHFANNGQTWPSQVFMWSKLSSIFIFSTSNLHVYVWWHRQFRTQQIVQYSFVRAICRAIYYTLIRKAFIDVQCNNIGLSPSAHSIKLNMRSRRTVLNTQFSRHVTIHRSVTQTRAMESVRVLRQQ